MAVHVSISGYAGAGKTTISRLLASRHPTVWVPRITSRRRRVNFCNDAVMCLAMGLTGIYRVESEVRGTEYEFIPKDEFISHIREGRMLEWHVLGEKEEGLTGILRPEYWPNPVEGTELLLSVFGSHAPEVKKVVPGLITVFLDVKNPDILRQRIYARTGKGKMEERNKKNSIYRRENIAQHFDHVVLSETGVERCVEEIEKIAGLTSPSNRKLTCIP
jgi:guanylate kinase